MSANNWLAQYLADMLRLSVMRPSDVETTARGAAMLAAVGAGLHHDLAAAAEAMLPAAEDFVPRPVEQAGTTRLEGWRRLLAASE